MRYNNKIEKNSKVKKIAFFNHKGGVSKTTTAFNLGWMLASKDNKVILVDTDPQCNLTGMFLSRKIEDDESRIEKIYSTHSNIKSGLAVAFESQPRIIEALDCVASEEKEGLYLLPGHVGLAEYEITLSIAQELSGSIQTLKNLPGSITYLLNKTADKYDADYMLIDMSPSLSSINQNLLMASDFFIVPTTADFFSVMAIDSLTKVLPKWYQWAKQLSKAQTSKEVIYPFPDINLKFLGIIIQNMRILRNNKTVAFQSWIQKTEDAITSKLIPVLRQNNMLLAETFYKEQRINDTFCLTTVSNFNSLIALSQKYGIPIYDLTAQQLNQTGKVLRNNQEKQIEFQRTFEDLASKVMNLTKKY